MLHHKFTRIPSFHYKVVCGLSLFILKFLGCLLHRLRSLFARAHPLQ